MKRASSPFPAEFSGMAYFPLPIPAETSYAECRRFSDSLPGNAVFMANPACPVMKEPIPIQQWLPAGPLRDPRIQKRDGEIQKVKNSFFKKRETSNITGP